MPVETKVTTTEVVQPKLQEITIADRVISVASSQVGNQEEPRGSNWGKSVQKYLASVGIPFAAAWCVAFVYWCVNEACKEMKVANMLPKTGGVLDLWNRIDPKYKVVGAPQKGDIFIMDFGKGKGHAGLVTGVKGNRILTIEGNSNDEGARDGHEVCRHPDGRSISSINKGFIRLTQ